MRAIRLQNFKGFRDSGWIELKPLTLLFGYNSSGKSSILNALLMLKQSLENPAVEVPFVFSSDKGVDLGTYEDIVYGHKVDYQNPIVFSFEVSLESDNNVEILDILKKKWDELRGPDVPETPYVRLSVAVYHDKHRKTNEIIRFSISDADQKIIFSCHKKNLDKPVTLYIHSDYYETLEKQGIVTGRHNFLPSVTPYEGEKHPLKNLTTFLQIKIDEAFKKISNIGPVRAVPKRTQLFTGEAPSFVGIRGENALQMLYLNKYSDHPDYLENKVNEWLSGYDYKFEWKMLGTNMGQFILTDTRTGLKVPLKDVGFGISQVLPVVIQAYAAQPGSTLLIEQPEIHLHSRAQAELGDLFLKAVNSYAEKEVRERKRLIIETHSENLLLRIRRRLAENYLQKAPDMDISAEEIAIYFIENTDGESIAHKISMNDKGEFENMPNGFRNFFADDFEEIMKINTSLAQIKAGEK